MAELRVEVVGTFFSMLSAESFFVPLVVVLLFNGIEMVGGFCFIESGRGVRNLKSLTGGSLQFFMFLTFGELNSFGGR